MIGIIILITAILVLIAGFLGGFAWLMSISTFNSTQITFTRGIEDPTVRELLQLFLSREDEEELDVFVGNILLADPPSMLPAVGGVRAVADQPDYCLMFLIHWGDSKQDGPSLQLGLCEFKTVPSGDRLPIDLRPPVRCNLTKSQFRALIESEIDHSSIVRTMLDAYSAERMSASNSVIWVSVDDVIE